MAELNYRYMLHLSGISGMTYLHDDSFTARFKEEMAVNILSFQHLTIF